MDYKEVHITRLRKLVNDVDAVVFSKEEIEEFLTEAPNIYLAAFAAWTVRAALLEGDIESYSAGNERYDLTSLKDRLDHALKMAANYKEMGGGSSGGSSSSSSFMLGVKRPGVM